MSRRTQTSKGPWLWPLIFIIIGVALLLNNFLLLGDFNVTTLLPLILVLIGAQVLLRGDFSLSIGGRTFGITRGSVESATLEINAGDIDVGIRMLRESNQDRLIAGQYAVQSRPELQVDGVHSHLIMNRNKTPWFSFTDWEMGLAKDLPWQLYVSTNIGQIDINLAETIVWQSEISSGIGDIQLIAPFEAFNPIRVRSTLGNIHLNVPGGYRTKITVQPGRFFGLHVNENRYEEVEPHVFFARGYDTEAPLVELHISGTFGDLYLA